MPDSRAELDTEKKVVKMLVSAYPDNTYNMCAEFSSDNVDDYGSIKSYNQLQGRALQLAGSKFGRNQ